MRISPFYRLENGLGQIKIIPTQYILKTKEFDNKISPNQFLLGTSTIMYLMTILLLSCSESNTPIAITPPTGIYVLLNDTCRTIEFTKDKIQIRRSCTKIDIDKITPVQGQDGIIRDRYCYDYLDMTIDSIDSNGAIFISAWDRLKEKCYGFHIETLDDLLIVTPLKIGKDIDYHFTNPFIYTKQGNNPTEKVQHTITFSFNPTVSIGPQYIAFNQPLESNYSIDQSGNFTISFTGDINHKTSLEISPKYLAFKSYKINVGQQAISVIYNEVFNDIRKMTDADRLAYFDANGFTDTFAVVHRFNPGRVRVVNKLYGESIVGQVQDIELIGVDECCP